MQAAGVDVDRVRTSQPLARSEKRRGLVELHIEQGRCWWRGSSIGIVTASRQYPSSHGECIGVPAIPVRAALAAP